MTCNHDCFHCEFSDCICDSETLNESEIDQFALTPEQLKKKESFKRWSQHGRAWAINHKEEIKAYRHNYYLSHKKAASSLQTESGAVEN